MSEPIFPITININETQTLDRNNQAVRIGIPFPIAEINAITELELINDRHESIPFQATITASWPDHSIRWLLVDFFVSIKRLKQCSYFLSKLSNEASPMHPQGIVINDTENTVTIDTGVAKFNINKNEYAPFNSVVVNGSLLEIKNSAIELIDSQQQQCISVIEETSFSANNGALRCTLNFKGHFKTKSAQQPSSFLNFKSSLTFFYNSALCELEFTLHNPNAAKHLGGFWDMGDPGSEYFKSLIFNIQLKNSPAIEWKDNNNTAWNALTGKHIRLYQNSSGGEHWNHHIHIDKNAQSTVTFKGYQLKVDDDIMSQGNRTSPAFKFSHNNIKIETCIKQFWQNFPKAISIDNTKINLEIFPATLKSDYELQAGEQKTHTVLINFQADQQLQQSIYPLNVTLPLSVYAQSNALPNVTENAQLNKLNTLIKRGIEGDNNFFSKREHADEFGWRNFGELWADHETLEHGNDESLVSHYNNQYDPIYGFAQQYILTGDQRWFKLMEDLAKHVIDIDIYRTEQDRPEYNNGLFWHTDHYLDGRHCTHRTFSKTHMNIDHVEQSGGGPGSEHCYSTGLMVYYFLTGNTQSHSTFLDLATWSKRVTEGSETVLERVFLFVKKDLSNIRRIIKGEYLFAYQFPLSRGTANYINTLLDSYTLSAKQDVLDKAFWVINNTLKAHDPIDKRALITDIESNWHYTILLQSVAKYLLTKEDIGQTDQPYHQVLKSFLHYANWVYNNERPYLDNADLLVYPNDTWVAQDTRKAYILAILTRYCPQSISHDINKKIEAINNNIYKHFTQKNNITTRIQAILMQNPIFDINNVINRPPFEPRQDTIDESDHIKLSVFSILKGLVLDVSRKIIKTNFKDEFNWIKNKIL